MQNKIRSDFLHNLRRPAADGEDPVITVEPFNQIIAHMSVIAKDPDGIISDSVSALILPVSAILKK
jgi:hypothetical protein